MFFWDFCNKPALLISKTGKISRFAVWISLGALLAISACSPKVDTDQDLAVSVFIDGKASTPADDGSYVLPNTSIVNLTCTEVDCTIDPSGVNTTYKTAEVTNKSWVGNVIGSQTVGTFKLTASANNHANKEVLFIVAAPIVIPTTEEEEQENTQE